MLYCWSTDGFRIFLEATFGKSSTERKPIFLTTVCGFSGSFLTRKRLLTDRFLMSSIHGSPAIGQFETLLLQIQKLLSYFLLLFCPSKRFIYVYSTYNIFSILNSILFSILLYFLSRSKMDHFNRLIVFFLFVRNGLNLG